MTRSITRSLPLLAAFLIFLSSCSSDLAITGKRHYGNSMYVKAGKHKQESTTGTSASAASPRTSDDLALLPQREAKADFTSDRKASPLRQLKNHVTAALPRIQKDNSQAQPASFANNIGANAPQMVQTVNVTKSETAQVDGGDITNVLVIIGVILIILAIVTLILEVAPAGWIGLLIAGLLIILLAYLLF